MWVRGVGGEVTNTFSTNVTGSLTAPGAPGNNSAAAANCNGSIRDSFSGVQVGQDISRLNWGGWNVHLGTTAGYLSSHSVDNSGNTADFEVPFLGTYLVATHGRFFADLMVREEFYNINLNSPGVGLFNQPVGGRGLSVATSAGYNFALANNWFIEPSAGFIWSSTNIDSFNVSGSPESPTNPSGGIVTNLATNQIISEMGRASLRAGTTVTSGNVIWQPFGSVSVFHEFAGNVTATGSTLPGQVVLGGLPIAIAGQTSTSRVGTYGQYSLGLAGQIVNTGWLGFVRVDYRDGENINGWTGNAGIRYQFTPEMIAAVMPTKVPVKAVRPVIGPTNWTGFYVGGFLGMAYGNTDIRFVGDPVNSGNNPRVFGGLGGGEIGYNYQVQNWVFGVEGDIGAANLHGARTCGTTFFGVNGFSPAFLTCQDNSNWMATAAARVGWSWERTLFYVKGGGAWTDDTVSVGCIYGPNNATNNPALIDVCRNQTGALTNGFNASGTRAGVLIGFGTEFDFGHNWSAKAEYDYIDFGSRTALASDGTTYLRDSGAISQVKIGVNYRFSPGVVVAKY